MRGEGSVGGQRHSGDRHAWSVRRFPEELDDAGRRTQNGPSELTGGVGLEGDPGSGPSGGVEPFEPAISGNEDLAVSARRDRVALEPAVELR